MLPGERVSGAELAGRVQQLIHEGNVRRIVVKHEGQTIVEFPLTVGVAATVVAAPVVAAGAMAALIKECTIEVERNE